MILKLLGLAFTIAAGWRAGSPGNVSVPFGVFAVAAAVALHSVLKIALPHDAIETLAARSSQEVVVLIALLETAGLWAPVALLPWGAINVRLSAPLYIIGAAVTAAALYYFPFDVVILRRANTAPSRVRAHAALLPAVRRHWVDGAEGYRDFEETAARCRKR